MSPFEMLEALANRLLLDRQLLVDLLFDWMVRYGEADPALEVRTLETLNCIAAQKLSSENAKSA